MARRKSKRSGEFMRLALIALACFGVGAGGAWMLTHSHEESLIPKGSRSAPAGVPWDGKPQIAAKSGSSHSLADPNSGLAGMSHTELEGEVMRLQRAIDDRDKQIADLMIQVKLQSAGSAAAGKPGI